MSNRYTEQALDLLHQHGAVILSALAAYSILLTENVQTMRAFSERYKVPLPAELQDHQAEIEQTEQARRALTEWSIPTSIPEPRPASAEGGCLT